MRHRSELSADPLSDLLSFLQARCELSGRFRAGGPWARHFANLDAIKFCAAIEGSCWYFMEGMPEPARLEAGDILVTNGTRSLILASAPALIAGATTTPLVRDSDGQYRIGVGDDFAMLGGSLQLDADRQDFFLNCLPPLIHVSRATDDAAPIAWLLEKLVTEMKSAARPGRAVVISGFAQLLFVQTLRAYLAHAPSNDSGWLKSLSDPRLAIALSCIHHEPSRDWSLEGLAKEANMSRTSFAVRFSGMMGIPPLTYLAQWRIHLAKRDIRAGVSVPEAAANVGYTSESAFRNAFKRVTAMTPGQYRQTCGG